MESLESFLLNAEQNCQENEQRLTQKRKLILSALLISEKALSAYEIIDYCKQTFSVKLPAMSVYRILEFLVEQGLVHKLEIANRFIACEQNQLSEDSVTHQYQYCIKCKQVKNIRIDPTLIEQLKIQLSHAGLNLKDPQLELSCICEKCKQAEE